ncbi:TetR/AcrR family transcriptional regulator [Cryptosporangium japonicum]|uniref:ABC-F family ATP-binding cassette domain-containing protein n=1 Tax=Cryptosporangium japonicum TaxID=80872 RepID=A0ABP3E9J4_9ACTN
MVRASSGNRRTDILDAAIDLVAEAGLRGLTHRAVDAGAGLPEGSTSAYFRTRAALLTAVVVRLGERIGADVDELAEEAARHPGDTTHAIEETLKQFDCWLSDPAPLLARLELSLESTRRPELGEAMNNWRTAFEAHVARMLADLGLSKAGERATLIVACMDGILLRALTSAPADEARRTAVDEARTLLTSLLISAQVLDSGQDPLTDVMPG